MSTRRERAKAQSAQQSKQVVAAVSKKTDNMDLIGAIATMGGIVVVLWIGTAIYLRIKEGY